MFDPFSTIAFGPASWWFLIVLATASAVLIDSPIEKANRRTLWSHSIAILVFGASAIWAVSLAWDPVPSESRRQLEAVAWWLPVIPVLWLGAFSTQPSGTISLSRLAAVQAVPAILLSFAPALGWRAVGAFAAGAARIAIPPLHPMNLAAAEALTPGSLLLVLIFGLVIGGPLAVRGIAEMPVAGAYWIGVLLSLILGFVGAASVRDAHLLRRISTWSAVQGALAILVVLLPSVALGKRPTDVAMAHLGACAAVLPVMIFAVGRIVLFYRVPDIRAYGGLASEAPGRARLLMAVLFVAVISSSAAAVALVSAIGGEIALLPRIIYVAALVGWFGTNLSVVLGGYRVIRGVRPAPGDPVPEVGRPEAIILILLIAIALVSRWIPGLWELPLAWSLQPSGGG